MTDPEIAANIAQWKARREFQKNLDAAIAGSPTLRAALELRYKPMLQFIKEGPDVGYREEQESEAGRVN